MSRVAKSEYILIILGCFFLAVGLNCFLEPNKIVIGGATGLAIIIESLSREIFGISIPIWLGNIAINLPLFAISVKIYGFKFLKPTIFATLFLSVALFVTSFIPQIKVDFLIACVFGSLACGVGLGMIFKSKATTGGSDLVASLIYKYNKRFSVSRLMMIIDVIIICLGFFVFGTIPAFYAILGAFIIAKVIDAVVEGVGFAKAVFIISEKSEEIGELITQKLERGATRFFGEGLYSKKAKSVICCVVPVKQISSLKEITAEIDENAFIFVTDVREVLGEFERK